MGAVGKGLGTIIGKPVGGLIGGIGSGAPQTGFQAQPYQYDPNAFNNPNLAADKGRFANYLNGSDNSNVANKTLMDNLQGKGNSVAQQQMLLAQDNAFKQNLAAATAQRGNNAGLGLRNALNANADNQAQIAGQGGILRAQEQAQSLNQYMQQQQFYEQLAYAQQLQQMQAQQELEKLRGEQSLGAQGINYNVAKGNTDARNQFTGGILGAAAGGAAAASGKH